MNKNNQTKQIVAAGTITGLLLAVFMVFGGRTLLSPVGIQNPANALTVTIDAESPAELQAQNEALQNAVLVMQEREMQYQEQIQLANQTIDQLQAPAVVQYDESEEEAHEEEDEAAYWALDEEEAESDDD